jgi:oxygen-independent coproporphyrinogen-3 oxidase
MWVKGCGAAGCHENRMWPYHPDLLRRAVPRYTSYPTAAEFDDGVGAADLLQALDQVGKGDLLSLYIHIPFCRDICNYCGCNTGRANRKQRLATYLDALEAEIDLVAHALAGNGRVHRIAFGGGSPNAIEPLAFVRLVDRLLVRFAAAGATISVELDPRTLDKAWLDCMRVVGVERISLGVQTFNAAVQAAIGRIQPDAMIERAVEGLRGAGAESINFDLMYGLPGQTVDDVRYAVERSIALGADRAALFGYAHLPDLLPRQRLIDAAALPTAEERFQQAAAGYEAFTAAGYVPVGFDHFARPGDALAEAAAAGTLRRNFQGFTEDRSDRLIGLGASAISQFPDLLVQNEKNSGRYRMLANAGTLPARRGIRRSPASRRRAAIIEQLLCQGRLSSGSPLIRAAASDLAPFVEHGLLRLDDGLEISAAGLPYSRLIAACFDEFRVQSANRFSSAI